MRPYRSGGAPDRHTPSPLVTGLACLLVVLLSDQAFAQGRAYYWGDHVVAGDELATRLDPPTTTTNLALGGMNGGMRVDGAAVTSGGSMIAVAGADAGGVNGVLNVYGPLGGAPVVTLHAGDADDDYSNLSFSPDSAWVAFIADIDLDGSSAVYVVPAGGGAVKRVSQAPVSTATDVTGYVWAHDSQTIAFAGDPVTNGVRSIWTVEVTAPVPSPIEIPMSTADPDVGFSFAFDAGDRLYFVSDFEVDGLFRLYRSDKDGSNLEQVPGTGLSNGAEADVAALGMAPDGARIAFSANAPDASIYQVYTMPLSGSTPTLVSNLMTTPDLAVRGPELGEIAWSPDGTRLAVLADWDTGDGAADGDVNVFVLPSSGPPGGIRVLVFNFASSKDVTQAEFVSNTALLVLGDLVVNNDVELYLVSDLSTADQDPGSVLVQDVPVGGDVAAFVVQPQPFAPPVPDEPAILSISDVGNDQGRQVTLEWRASGLDAAGSQTPILEYAIFRQIDPDLAPWAIVEPVFPEAALLTGWHYVTSVPAFAESTYAVVVPTLRDSTVSEGPYNTTFLVRAATAVPSVYVDSAPDSGYSVDNLAPAAPMSLAFGATRVLVWDEAAEEDFAHHTVYGSPTGDMGEAVVLGYTTGETFDVNAMPNAFYLVTTTDHSGNESPPASLEDQGTLGAGGPGALPSTFAFVSARPNPFRLGTVLNFELPSAGEVDVRVFDSNGRIVRVLAGRRFEAGRHTVRWDGTTDAGQRVSPGVYYARIAEGGKARSKSIVRVD